jgi:redox-sensitive bicupin YhaK (pirin superfamily)
MDRFVTRERGRQTRHSFSFGSHYDPERVSFGPLVALNDDLLGPGVGYDAHEHRDVVLVTWVVSGELAHEDAAGRTVQPPGQLAIIRAGRGISHSEHAASGAVRFVQAWLQPDAASPDTDEPGRRTSTPDLGDDELVVVADGKDLGVAGATYRIADLAAGVTVTVPPAPKRYLFVATGALLRSSLAEPLHAGDAFEVTGDHDLTVTTAVPSQLLVWSFPD